MFLRSPKYDGPSRFRTGFLCKRACSYAYPVSRNLIFHFVASFVHQRRIVEAVQKTVKGFFPPPMMFVLLARAPTVIVNTATFQNAEDGLALCPSIPHTGGRKMVLAILYSEHRRVSIDWSCFHDNSKLMYCLFFMRTKLEENRDKSPRLVTIENTRQKAL